MRYRGRVARAVVIVLCLLGGLCPAAASAQGPASSGASTDKASIDSALPPGERGKTLTVGTKLTPPFVMRDGANGYTGLSIALWQRVAAKLHLKTHYVERDLSGLFTGLENGSLDVSVAALTVTEPREARVDFSYPFYTTGLAIALPASQGSSLWLTIRRLFSWQFFTALAALAGVLLLVGVVVWAFEHRHNREEFGGGVFKGLGSGFWWAAVTMTTVGYGDKSPRTLGGRLVGLVWMFAAIIIISSFTAAIATSLTVNRLSTGIQGVSDLAHARVATVSGSAAAAALADRGIGFRATHSLDAALTALADDRVDAVVYDAPLLKYRIRKAFPDRLRVLATTFERQDYAFALPQGSPLREPIDRAILATLAGSDWNRLVARFVGSS